MLDHARIHKREKISRIVCAYNYSFKFLSPYSYMVNPTEKAFSKIKNFVRSQLRIGFNGSLSDIIMKGCSEITSLDARSYTNYIIGNMINTAAGLPHIHR